MDPRTRAQFEARIKQHCEADELDDAATVAIKAYGPEILGYLVSVARSEADAADVFSTFTEDLWKGLGKFRWEASFRTWAYTIARNAFRRLGRDQHRKPGRQVPLSQSPEILDAAEKVRTETLKYLRTEVKDGVARLRERLDPDDQTLFILRINRRMPWKDIAQVMLDEGEEPTKSALDRKYTISLDSSAPLRPSSSA
jgi:RNA polymerase sigma-70 factor (ECF subfamily)